MRCFLVDLFTFRLGGISGYTCVNCGFALLWCLRRCCCRCICFGGIALLGACFCETSVCDCFGVVVFSFLLVFVGWLLHRLDVRSVLPVIRDCNIVALILIIF